MIIVYLNNNISHYVYLILIIILTYSPIEESPGDAREKIQKCLTAEY